MPIQSDILLFLSSEFCSFPHTDFVHICTSVFNIFGGDVNGAVFNFNLQLFFANIQESNSLLGGCAGFSLLHVGCLQLWRTGATRVVVCELLMAVASLVEHGFIVCGLQQLLPVGSVIATHRLSCPAARGTFPDQGSNQCPLHCKVDS